MLHFITADPGLVCGIAVLTIALEPHLVVTFSSHEMPWRDAVSYVNRWSRSMSVLSQDKLYMGAERWDNAPGKRPMTPQPEALMTIGALDYTLSQCDVTLRLQGRAEAKTAVSDALLRKLGWYKKTKDGHANDAARHCGLLVLQSHPELWLRLIDGVE